MIGKCRFGEHYTVEMKVTKTGRPYIQIDYGAERIRKDDAKAKAKKQSHGQGRNH